tara:strand:- start:686 stop:865 length:180 start_codon:yes stop_codon:yes gene_type:complete
MYLEKKLHKEAKNFVEYLNEKYNLNNEICLEEFLFEYKHILNKKELNKIYIILDKFEMI